MADWCGTGRSNYFKVKDEEKFLAWVSRMPGFHLISKSTSEGFGFYMEEGTTPSTFIDEESGEEEADFDFIQELSEHLAEGEVCVYMEAGAEKLRYVSGTALAVNHKGEVLTVHLSNIYDLVKQQWGLEPTEATY